MGEGTKISWATDTINFWAGCTKVSPACANCYAERDTKRRGFVEWGPGKDRRLVKNARPNALRWNREAQEKGIDRRVFAFSWADWLDHEVPIEWLYDFLSLVRETPNLTWLLLSKRLERWLPRLVQAHDTFVDDLSRAHTVAWIAAWIDGYAPHNVWLGTTVEDQRRADERIPLLLNTPARLKFMSMEPLLEAVDISPALVPWKGISWNITGGESGPNYRELPLDAVRSIRDACVRRKIPFHHKQHSSLKPGGHGRELDGKIWDQIPGPESHALAQLAKHSGMGPPKI